MYKIANRDWGARAKVCKKHWLSCTWEQNTAAAEPLVYTQVWAEQIYVVKWYTLGYLHKGESIARWKALKHLYRLSANE